MKVTVWENRAVLLFWESRKAADNSLHCVSFLLNYTLRIKKTLKRRY